MKKFNLIFKYNFFFIIFFSFYLLSLLYNNLELFTYFIFILIIYYINFF